MKGSFLHKDSRAVTWSSDLSNAVRCCPGRNCERQSGGIPEEFDRSSQRGSALSKIPGCASGTLWLVLKPSCSQVFWNLLSAASSCSQEFISFLCASILLPRITHSALHDPNQAGTINYVPDSTAQICVESTSCYIIFVPLCHVRHFGIDSTCYISTDCATSGINFITYNAVCVEFVHWY